MNSNRQKLFFTHVLYSIISYGSVDIVRTYAYNIFQKAITI